MQKDDVKTMKRKVESIIFNISLYRRDIKKHMKKLKSRYGIPDIDNIDDIIKELVIRIQNLEKKKQKLLTEARSILKD